MTLKFTRTLAVVEVHVQAKKFIKQQFMSYRDNRQTDKKLG